VAEEIKETTESGETSTPPKTNESSGGGSKAFFVRLCYGYVGSYKDTSTMTTEEVIEEFLDKNGVRSPKEFFEKKFKPEQEQKSQPEKPKDIAFTESAEESRNKMLSSERIRYNTIITKKKLKEVLEIGENGVGEATTRLFNADSFGIDNERGSSAYYPVANKISVMGRNFTKEEKGAYQEYGQAFYHECWHAIDNNYNNDVEKDRYGLPTSTQYLSLTHVLSTGITFEDTLIEEYKTINLSQLKDEVNQAVQSYFKSKYGMSKDEIKETYKALESERSKTWNEKGYEAISGFWNIPENKKIRDAYYDTLSIPVPVVKMYSDMSDIVSGGTQGRESLVQCGHTMGYWLRLGSRGKEAFAEVASAKATNPKSYDVMKKYLPNTVKAFEEIYSKLVNGEIKSRGRAKYEH
jgi:hypothetical protein